MEVLVIGDRMEGGKGVVVDEKKGESLVVDGTGQSDVNNGDVDVGVGDVNAEKLVV